jgi:hypothetical protein
MDKMICFKLVIIIILSGLLAACSLEGDIEARRQKSHENPEPSIPAPGTPVVTASDGLLTMRWPAVEEAEKYAMYISTSQKPPASPQKTVSVTTTIVDSLINKTVYYVWIKAINKTEYSDFSPRGRGIPWPANEVPAVPERPVIISGITQLTVNWEETGGASSYEVYINTTPSVPSESAVTSDKTSAAINNLENDIIYYIWVRAVNNVGKSGYSPVEAGTPRIPTVAPAAPASPVLIAGSRELSVSWQAVELASAYEVWFGTNDNSTQAQKFGSDITGGITEIIITGLNNEQTYYVWMKAKNFVGTSGFSPPVNARPSAFATLPETPEMPAVIPGSGELSVSWQTVEGALLYELWIGTTDDPADAQKYGTDISGTSTTLTELVNGTTYYIWLRAKNTNGTGDFSTVASGIPSSFNAKPLAPSSVPSVSAGNAQLVVNWLAVEGAISYGIFAGTTSDQTSATKRGNVFSPSGTITGLTNGTTYYVWIKAENNVGISDFGPMASGKPIANMGAITLVSGNGQLTASWSAVAGANEYEVYHSTNTTIPANPAQTVTTTTATISGLINGLTYYVWVKGRNTTGAGSASVVVSAKPLGTPGAPTVSPAYKQLLVTWTTVPGADEYEVYYGTGTVPTTLATTTTGTTATITGLTNGTTVYYVRLRAKNANGFSGYGPNASSTPSVTPGLYRGAEKIGNQNLSASLTYISSNAVSGDDFYIVLGANESTSPINLNYSGKTVGITLLGYGGERTITLALNGNMFTIPAGNTGLTLTLNENITLVGRSTNTNSLISLNSGNLVINSRAKIKGNNADFGGGIGINSGGTATINGGEISGNTANSGGGGIVVYSGGTVTMNSGIINGNGCQGGYGGGGIFVFGGTLTMYDGIISGNTSDRFGGGVYVYTNGSFTMHGGIISGNTAGQSGGGVELYSTFFKKLPYSSGQNSGIIYGSTETGVDASGIPLKNTASNGYGHVVQASTPSTRRRNTTAGQTDHIDTTTGRGLSTDGNPPYGQ